MISDNFHKIKIVKLFASSEYKTRNAAHKMIMKMMKWEFGTGKRQLSTKEIAAVWKGLYVWLQMQDKPILHEEVVDKICGLLDEITCEQVAMEFMREFFTLMNREWCNIDKHRLAKYYMLVRQFFRASLQWLKNRNWSNVDEYLTNLKKSLLIPDRNRGPGVRMHFASFLLDELVGTETNESTITKFVSQVILASRTSDYDQIYLNRLRTSVIEKAEQMYNRGALNIDLHYIGTQLAQIVAEKPPMKRKMAKMFLSYSTRFIGKKFGDKLEEAQMDTEEHQPSQPEQANNVQDKIEAESNDKDEQCDSSIAMDVDAPAASTKPTKSKKKSKKAKKLTNGANPEPQATPVSKPEEPMTIDVNKQRLSIGSDTGDERRVTFGKRYTKKFSKSTTSIAMSQATAKQQEIKSILKHK